MRIQAPRPVIDENDPFKHALFDRKKFGESLTALLQNVEDSAEKDALKTFRESLTKLAKKFREERGFPLTIIVDELDRCRPDFAMNLLERIKHLFDVEGIAFVLLVNRKQIESYVRAIYGKKVDARGYLLKFANLFVDLPSQNSIFRHDVGKQEFAVSSLKHYGVFDKGRDSSHISGSMSMLVAHFELTLREIEKVSMILGLYYASLPQNQVTHEFVVAVLAVLKIKNPNLYQRLRAGTVFASEFFSETGLDHFPKDQRMGYPSQDWVLDTLNYCLLAESDFSKLEKEEPSSTYPKKGPLRMATAFGHMNRSKVIPFFCSRLDQFALAPK
jgi:hypothetical protein